MSDTAVLRDARPNPVDEAWQRVLEGDPALDTPTGRASFAYGIVFGVWAGFDRQWIHELKTVLTQVEEFSGMRSEKLGYTVTDAGRPS
jgi:hypothetical protein